MLLFQLLEERELPQGLRLWHRYVRSRGWLIRKVEDCVFGTPSFEVTRFLSLIFWFLTFGFLEALIFFLFYFYFFWETWIVVNNGSLELEI